MQFAVAAVGLLITVAGLAFLLAPRRLRALFDVFLARRWMMYAALFRIAVGILLVIAAPATRAPNLVLALGIIAIIAGLALPILGHARVERFARSWLERSDIFLRAWGLAAIAFGAVIVWAAIPF